jgi:hypothetical protein
VLTLRDAHPSWGGRKLARRPADIGGADPGWSGVPQPSTMTEILRRGGRPDVSPVPQRPLQRFEHAQPGELWQMDFKGRFAAGTGRCHPLSVLDDHPRFALGVEACADARGATVQARLTAIFRRYGLPRRLSCDKGPPPAPCPRFRRCPPPTPARLRHRRAAAKGPRRRLLPLQGPARTPVTGLCRIPHRAATHGTSTANGPSALPATSPEPPTSRKQSAKMKPSGMSPNICRTGPRSKQRPPPPLRGPSAKPAGARPSGDSPQRRPRPLSHTKRDGTAAATAR